MGKKEKENELSIKRREYSLRYVVLAILFWLLTITWILLIFLLSNEEGNASDSTSKMVQSYTNNYFSLSLLSNSTVRTLAHVLEFALLTMLSYFAIDFTNRISKKTSYAESPIKILKSDNEMNIFFTLWFAMINALADEYHQLFVKDRTGSIVDVLKDMIGIILVLAIIRLVFTIYLAIRGRKEVRYG